MILKWVTLKVKDLDKSIKFYKEILKLPLNNRFETKFNRIAMMGDRDAPKIELIEEGDSKLKILGEGVSIGLEVEDLEETVDYLRGKKLDITDIISPSENIKFCFIKDPDNYRIQLFEELN